MTRIPNTYRGHGRENYNLLRSLLLGILIMGIITEQKGSQEEAGGREPYEEKKGDDFLLELHQIEN